MGENLVPVTGYQLPADGLTPAQRLYQAWLGGRSVQTRRAYEGDLKQFAAFCRAESPETALRLFLALDAGAANHVALQWRSAMLEAKLSPATINRRLAALRSLAKLGRTLGMIAWGVEIGNVSSQAYLDTAGPGEEAFRRMLAKLGERTDTKGVRDYTMVRVLYDLGLRRSELCRLNVGDLDLERRKLMVLGKGRREPKPLSVPPRTVDIIKAWLQRCASIGLATAPSSPLFVSINRHGGPGARLTGDGLYRVVRDLGLAVGIKTRTHALRHQSITDVLTLTNGNIIQARDFARHRSAETTLRYNDNREDHAGDLARRLSERF